MLGLNRAHLCRLLDDGLGGWGVDWARGGRKGSAYRCGMRLCHLLALLNVSKAAAVLAIFCRGPLGADCPLSVAVHHSSIAVYTCSPPSHSPEASFSTAAPPQRPDSPHSRLQTVQTLQTKNSRTAKPRTTASSRVYCASCAWTHKALGDAQNSSFLLFAHCSRSKLKAPLKKPRERREARSVPQACSQRSLPVHRGIDRGKKGSK